MGSFPEPLNLVCRLASSPQRVGGKYEHPAAIRLVHVRFCNWSRGYSAAVPICPGSRLPAPFLLSPRLAFCVFAGFRLQRYGLAKFVPLSFTTSPSIESCRVGQSRGHRYFVFSQLSLRPSITVLPPRTDCGSCILVCTVIFAPYTGFELRGTRVEGSLVLAEARLVQLLSSDSTTTAEQDSAEAPTYVHA
eukprot:4294061-Pleurochrysis_carterae.AAC.6